LFFFSKKNGFLPFAIAARGLRGAASFRVTVILHAGTRITFLRTRQAGHMLPNLTPNT
jgi:hypothetical protein